VIFQLGGRARFLPLLTVKTYNVTKHFTRLGLGLTLLYDVKEVYRDLVERPEGKRPLERPRWRGGLILKWIFRKRDGGHRLD